MLNRNIDLNSFVLTLPFSYTIDVVSKTYNSALSISYAINDSGQLYIADSNNSPINLLSLANIHNNLESSSQVVYLHNRGTIPAANISTQIDTSSNKLFSIQNSNCTQNLNPDEYFQITIKFGATNTNANDYTLNLLVTYNSAAQSQQQLTKILNGTVLNANSAELSGFITSSNFSGSGVISDPYVVK